MNWRLAVIPVTLIPIIIIAVQFDIEAEDIFAIGAIPFALAVLAIMTKLGLQGLKLAYIARTFLGPFDSIKRLTAMRVGSEFIKFTTPMFVGAEFAVIYYMTKKGISTSKASWVALLDIVTEVFAAGVLSILAGILALMYGAYVVGVVVLGTSIPITGLWIVLFFMSSKRTFTLPRVISYIATTLGKERGQKYVKQTNGWIEDVCIMSRENLHSSKSKKVFVVGFFVS
ncbi:MAG: TIGR00374 family protein, partial [Thaumarchaeota archaeon]|nr:TIGR00374 family protein [Nitrososphaerota archaeon]